MYLINFVCATLTFEFFDDFVVGWLLFFFVFRTSIPASVINLDGMFML